LTSLCYACVPPDRVVRCEIASPSKGVEMELSFASENSADASLLAQELELSLRRAGIPADALSLKQSSAANMDIGSVLSISLEILGSIGSAASFANCVYEMVAKHNSPVVIIHSDGKRDEISPGRTSFKRIEKAITRSVRPKQGSRLRT
jgi:hypothetical protein